MSEFINKAKEEYLNNAILHRLCNNIEASCIDGGFNLDTVICILNLKAEEKRRFEMGLLG